MNKEQKYESSGVNALKHWHARTILCTFVVIPFLIATPFIFSSRLPLAKAIFNDQSVEFTGPFGTIVPFENIVKFELLEKIPIITYKIRGEAISGVYRGFFQLNEFGACRLLLKTKHPPYLYIEQSNGEKMIFNSTDSTYTKDIYIKISEVYQIMAMVEQ